MAEISRESLGITDGKPKPTNAKPTEQKLKPVVSGGVERRQAKPNVVHRFFGGDPRDVGRYILLDIMLPAAKGLLLDIICKGSERLILGDTATDRERRRYPGAPAVRTNYAGISSGNVRTISPTARSFQEFDQIVFKDKQQGETVLARMYDRIDNAGVVRVSDLYDLCDITSNFVDRGWGWYKLSHARVIQIGSGEFVLDLPRPVRIDQ